MSADRADGARRELFLGMAAALATVHSQGPGAVAAEVDFSVGNLNHHVTGNVNAGGVVAQVGYHLLF